MTNFLVVALLLLAPYISYAASTSTTDVYIVYMGGRRRDVEAEVLTLGHYEMLASTLGSSEAAQEALVYSYRHALNGFSAFLTKEQADHISEMPGVLSVHPSKMYEIHTTRSWDFIGLDGGKVSPSGSSNLTDVIVGLLDTGIWPESQSFADKDMGPVPSRWKGECVNPSNMNASELVLCNRKLIGARYYTAYMKHNFPSSTTPLNARDHNGHGTHTSSTAVGNLVQNVSMAGFARGNARGGVPGARVAMYKVCWGIGCFEADILAGFDDAINDGVDVISVSIGGPPIPYSLDSIAIGAFHATERGISVACGAGNFNFIVKQVTNAAPWIFTIGASTIDRKITGTGTIDHYKPAPEMAFFSLRGPNVISPDIIKPDVTAPGVDILAAWPSTIPAVLNGKAYSVDYALLSGTSMATPHAGGAMAFVKSVHPSWSPAMIKSALMTTATTVDNTNKTISSSDPFAFGAGEIQPAKAVDPGLVYDIQPLDYIYYLCTTGYTSKQVQNITGDTSTDCSSAAKFKGLNYPSIGYNNLTGSKTVERTVTIVGGTEAVYTAQLGKVTDKRLSISVSPTKLNFTSSMSKASYSLTFSSNFTTSSGNLTWIFSSLTWTDGVHAVRSPIAVSLQLYRVR